MKPLILILASTVGLAQTRPDLGQLKFAAAESTCPVGITCVVLFDVGKGFSFVPLSSLVTILGPIFPTTKLLNQVAVSKGNNVWTLPSAPDPAQEIALRRNGIWYDLGADYTLSGSTVTFLAAQTTGSGDRVVANYYPLAKTAVVPPAGTGTPTPKIQLSQMVEGAQSGAVPLDFSKAISCTGNTGKDPVVAMLLTDGSCLPLQMVSPPGVAAQLIIPKMMKCADPLTTNNCIPSEVVYLNPIMTWFTGPQLASVKIDSARFKVVDFGK